MPGFVAPDVEPDSDDTFTWSFLPVECLEMYRPGGFHPVDLGDEILERYRILRKLGYSLAATVWLAIDLFEMLLNKTEKLVALKIVVADGTDTFAHDEVVMNTYLQTKAATGPVSSVVQMLDRFELEGPNGTHICLIFEVMGPSATYMIENLPPQYDTRPNPDSRHMARFPLWLAKSIIKQVLIGLEQFHSAGLVHANFRLESILFKTVPLLEQGAGDIISHGISPATRWPRSFHET